MPGSGEWAGIVRQLLWHPTHFLNSLRRIQEMDGAQSDKRQVRIKDCSNSSFLFRRVKGRSMMKVIRRMGRYLPVIASRILSCVMSGCLESSFQLASESRLPRWEALPSGLTREDASVTLNLYTTLPGANDAKFILRNRTGEKLAEVKGKVKCQYPDSAGLYPAYEAVVVNGTTEILEFKRMEPIFYVNDDPAIREKILADCRRIR